MTTENLQQPEVDPLSPDSLDMSRPPLNAIEAIRWQQQALVNAVGLPTLEAMARARENQQAGLAERLDVAPRRRVSDPIWDLE